MKCKYGNARCLCQNCKYVYVNDRDVKNNYRKYI